MIRLMTALGLVAGMTTLPVFAQEAPADTDGNGKWSMEELMAAYPNITEEVFAAMDTNADGEVDPAEFNAATGAEPPAQ